MIDARTLTQTFTAAPQIDPADMAEAIRMGFRHIVNNRPDGEVPDSHRDARMAAAAAEAGLGYTAIPVDHSGLSLEQVEALSNVLQSAEGPVLAYCRSGTRSTMLWALAQAKAGHAPAEIIETAAGAGYDVKGLLPVMESLARAG